MDLDIENISQGKLHNKVTFLLMKIKMKDKKLHQDLINEWEDADLSETKEVFKKIVEAYQSL